MLNQPTEILMALVLWISFEPFIPFSKSSCYLPLSVNTLICCQERTTFLFSPHSIVRGLRYYYLWITTKAGGKKKKKKLPNRPSTFTFRFPEEEAVLYLSCASLCSPPSANALSHRRNRDGRRAAAHAPACAVLWPWEEQNLLTVLPKLPWEPGGFSLPKHTQPRGYSLSTNTAPVFQAVPAEGWVAEAAHSVTPSLFFCSHASGARRP